MNISLLKLCFIVELKRISYFINIISLIEGHNNQQRCKYFLKFVIELIIKILI